MIIVILTAGLIVYKNQQNIKTSSSQIQTTTPSPTPLLSDVFNGILPCADCQGIDETLTLSKDSPEATGGAYKLKDVYLGKDAIPFETTGKWTIIKGSATDKNATVYKLTTEKGEVSYYLLADPDTLKPLDKQKKLIQAPFNLNLTRKYI